jgi:5-methylcytosine-specific restriction endonuclease McrA
MALRACLGGCGALTSGSRCSRCKSAPRNAGELSWAQLRARALRRASGRCEYAMCLTPHDRLAVHHVVALADGGANRLSNLRVYCHRHHVEAHTRSR